MGLINFMRLTLEYRARIVALGSGVSRMLGAIKSISRGTSSEQGFGPGDR